MESYYTVNLFGVFSPTIRQMRYWTSLYGWQMLPLSSLASNQCLSTEVAEKHFGPNRVLTVPLNCLPMNLNSSNADELVSIPETRILRDFDTLGNWACCVEHGRTISFSLLPRLLPSKVKRLDILIPFGSKQSFIFRSQTCQDGEQNRQTIYQRRPPGGANARKSLSPCVSHGDRKILARMAKFVQIVYLLRFLCCV